MSKNRAVNLIYRNNALWLALSATVPVVLSRDLHLASSHQALHLPLPPSQPPSLPLHFYVLWCRDNFSQFLKSTLLHCKMGLQRGHMGGGFWLMKCYSVLQHFWDLLFGNKFHFLECLETRFFLFYCFPQAFVIKLGVYKMWLTNNISIMF